MRRTHMNINQAKEIIDKEELNRVNWFDDSVLKENQVGIRNFNDLWIVYITDERANIMDGSETEFQNIEDALESLINKARYGKKRFG